MSGLSHVDDKGRATMVDVSSKVMSLRIAKASGFIKLLPETIGLVRENQIIKGDVIGISEIAGIQAAKRTADLIPLCHPLQLTKIKVRGVLESDGLRIYSEVHCIGKTGVEMEALQAVSSALLNIYDMCKAVDKEMEIGDITLLSKTKSEVQG